MTQKDASNDSTHQEIPTLSMCVSEAGVDWPKLMVYLDHQAQAFPLISSLSRVSRLSPGITLIVTVIGLLILCAFGRSAAIICDAGGLLYPGYKTYKVIKHFEGNATIRRAATAELDGAIGIDGSMPQEQLIFWAKYWVVYSLAFILKYPLFAIFFWCPFYDIFRLCLTVALFHPKLKGAELVFNFFVFPLLIQYEKHIDAAIEFVETKIGDFVQSRNGKILSKVNGHVTTKLAEGEKYLKSAAMFAKHMEYDKDSDGSDSYELD
ncbi:hypothetical protein X943_000851 [Babesia divergens]|uniref:HVA22-like protein n=1 Tax=Babesia divergens TaxID=32595 RepID=A0AAD9LHV0_BABDI|nr:hypothetical protein X943_000851 [Babesia divergens]